MKKSMGRDVSEGSLFNRIRAGFNMLSILVTWALENAIETSDSMRSRGYGLKGRTAFSIYKFTKKVEKPSGSDGSFIPCICHWLYEWGFLCKL